MNSLKSVTLMMFALLLFQTCTKKNELASTHYLKFNSMVIELEFVDDVQYPGQLLAISSNRQLLDTLGSDYLRILIQDSISMEDIYYQTMTSCDLTVKSPNQVRDFFVKVKIKTGNYSVVYLMKKRAVYNYYRTLFCKCQKYKRLDNKYYEQNIHVLRYILSAVDVKFIWDNAYKENAFGLDTFCR